MQTWKLKRLSKKRKQEWIEAIDRIIQRYETDTHFTVTCPFCSLLRYGLGSYRKGCANCLWKIFEGMDCSSYATAKGFRDVLEVEDRGYVKWKRLRLPTLRKWRKILIDFSKQIS